MADFPCPSERIAASALLLLSITTMPSISRSIFDFAVENGDSIGEASKIRSCQGSLVSSYSKSSSLCSSELSDVSTEAISARSSSTIGDIVHRRHDLNLKVVRKTRSKVQQVSGGWKISSAGGESSSMTSSFRSVSGADSSCLTVSTAMSSSADSSSAQSRFDRYVRRRKERLSAALIARGRAEAARYTNVGSAHIRRRAEEILKMLYEGCFSEVTIRQVLGDSPDTSKALRILLKLEKVKRSGLGGRLDPYIYMIAPRI